MDDGLVAVAAGFVKAARGFVGGRSRSLNEDESALLRGDGRFHVLQECTAHAPAPRIWVNGNPVEIPDPLGEGMGAKAGVPDDGVRVAAYEERVPALLTEL